MDDRRSEKLMLLFLAPDNPLWEMLLAEDERTRKRITEVVHVSHQSPGNWENTTSISPETAAKIFNSTLEHISTAPLGPAKQRAIEMVTGFRDAYGNRSVDIYDAAAHLSMSIDEAQRIVDRVIYSSKPVFPGMYFENKGLYREDANAVFKTYRGLYYAYMRRRDFWLRCILRVRYIIEIHSGLAIRCKLHLPIIEPEDDQRYLEYDGFLAVRTKSMFWMFENRDMQWCDYVHFATSIGRGSTGNLTLTGKYLTTDQDKQETIVSDDVILQRISRDEGSAAMRKTMQEEPLVIVDSAECSRLELILKSN